MEEQIPASQAPEPTQRITPEELEAMKAFAREQAIRMTYQQPPLVSQPPVSNLPYQPRPVPEPVQSSQPAVFITPQWPPTIEGLLPTYQPKSIPDLKQQPSGPEGYLRAETLEPRIVYIRRNLTVAEILLICVLSCTIVGGIQLAWGFASKHLPQIEVRVK